MISANPTSNLMIETNNDEEDASDHDDGVCVFVQDFALITQLSGRQIQKAKKWEDRIPICHHTQCMPKQR